MEYAVVLSIILVTVGLSGVFSVMPNKNGANRFRALGEEFFAHRGLHSKDKKIPENSLDAFSLAVESGYGIELDVQLSKDHEVVVFHDDDLKRMCGIDKKVNELTYEELLSLKLLDSECVIPHFKDVLDIVTDRSVLIVELKTGSNNEMLCEKTRAILSEYEGKYCIESFDPRIVGWFKKNAPGVVRGQLACPPKSYGTGTSKLSAFLLGNCLFNFISRPDFIAYQLAKKPLLVRLAQLLGAAKVSWTSRNANDRTDEAGIIFEFYKAR